MKTQSTGSPHSLLRAVMLGVLVIGFLTTIVPTMRLRHQFTWTPVDAIVTSIGEKCGYYYRERQLVSERSERTERWGNWQLGDIVDCTSFAAYSNKYPDRQWRPTPFAFTGVKFVLNGETKELFVNAQVMTPYPVEKGSILHVVVDTGPSFKMDRRFIWRDFFLLFRNLGFALIVAGLLEHLHRRSSARTTAASSRTNTVVRTRQLAENGKPKLQPAFLGIAILITVCSSAAVFFPVSVHLIRLARNHNWTHVDAKIIWKGERCEMQTDINGKGGWRALAVLDCAKANEFVLPDRYRGNKSRAFPAKYTLVMFESEGGVHQKLLPDELASSHPTEVGDVIPLLHRPTDPAAVDRQLTESDLRKWRPFQIAGAVGLGLAFLAFVRLFSRPSAAR